MTAPTPDATLFDPAARAAHRRRAAPRFTRHAFLHEEGLQRMIERLDTITRSFTRALAFGPHAAMTAAALAPRILTIETGDDIRALEPGRFDLIMSLGALHEIDDLPETLLALRLALAKGGLFLAMLPGGATLQELRSCLMDAELAATGGVSPRVAPMLDAASGSALLQHAGFALPVADRESVTLVYTDMIALMRELRGMGETNALAARLRHPTRRRIMDHAARLYRERYAAPDGGIVATVEAITLHGWNE